MNGGDSCLEICGLRKLRQQGESRFELSLPRLRVQPGEFVAVTGESGCGKSSLLDLLALISRPDACTAFTLASPAGMVDVKRLWEQEREAELAALRRTSLGYVLQTGGLLPYLSVRENLRLPCRLIGRPCDAAIARLSQRLGVENCLERLPDQLSGGQRQRAAILRALVHGPRLVLADEPTAAVDRRRARVIVDELHAIAQSEGSAIVMVTHDLELVRGIADHSYGFDLSSDGDHQIYSRCRQGEMP